jgi:cystathionine beta-lyase/cystathionine gamma-synthase
VVDQHVPDGERGVCDKRRRLLNLLPFVVPRKRKTRKKDTGSPWSGPRITSFYHFLFGDECDHVHFHVQILLQLHTQSADDIVVFTDELYCDVPKFIKKMGCDKWCTHHKVDPLDGAGIVAFFEKNKDNIKMFYFESCSNPTGRMFDWDLLGVLRTHSPGCLFVADNTWTSACGMNPIKLGADISVESMTKYNSGGEHIGGFVVGNNTAMAPILGWSRLTGIHIDAHTCREFCRLLDGLPDRTARSSVTTRAVVLWLEKKQSEFKNQGLHVLGPIYHPIMEIHPSHDVFTRSANGDVVPSCFRFFVNMSREKMEEASPFPIKTSYGGPDTRIDIYSFRGTVNNKRRIIRHEPHKTQYGESHNIPPKTVGMWVRLSVGYNDSVEFVTSGLGRMFEHVIQDAQTAVSE